MLKNIDNNNYVQKTPKDYNSPNKMCTKKVPDKFDISRNM